MVNYMTVLKQQFYSFLSPTLLFSVVLMLLVGSVEAQQSNKSQINVSDKSQQRSTQDRKVAGKQSSTLNASELVGSAQRALGVVVRAAKKETALSLNSAKAKPFWDAMKDLNLNLAKAETGLTLKDNTFFSALASANAAYAQAKIGLIMTGTSNPSIDKPVHTLQGILDTLNANFSKEAARLKQGGKLTAAEKKKLDKLIAQQDALLAKLDKVEKNVAANNKEIKKGIKKIRENSRIIKNSRYTVAGFAGGFFAAHITYDLLWGWHWWWGPWGGWAPGFIDVNVVVWDDWVDHYDYDWGLVDDYVDVADLEMDTIDIGAAEVLASEAYLNDGDFGLADGDLQEITSDIDYGWDDVTTDAGAEIMNSYDSNMDNSSVYEREVPIETFRDYGMDDMGGGFGGGDFGGDMGGMDFGGDMGGMDF